MYIKVFKSRDARHSYLIAYEHGYSGRPPSRWIIEDEEHNRLAIKEEDLFDVLHGFFNLEKQRDSENDHG